jgi:hydrogenase expression/formation protein HypD
MKYVDEYRDGTRAAALAATIRAEAREGRGYAFMEFCGGHTHAIARYGLEDLLPGNVRLIHGPGCPVCVLPIGRLEAAITLAADPRIILCTYADLMRVPAARGRSLQKARAEGADVRMVYSSLDALRIAGENPDREVVFLAIGFETTTPPTAHAVLAASRQGLRNFSVFCNHVLTPPAMRAILADATGARLDGVIGPSHVSTVIGSAAYDDVAATFSTPVVIAGFEPLDVLQSVLMLIRQCNAGRAGVENQYIRAVTAEGNRKAQAVMAETFVRRPSFAWRGLGELPDSALALAPAYAGFDAERRFGVETPEIPDNPACACGAILRGTQTPAECRLFGTVCTPQNPIGSCMVSAEGACAAAWTYGRHRERPSP